MSSLLYGLNKGYYLLMDTLLRFGRKLIPKGLFEAAQPIYHYLLALAGALLYRFPAHAKLSSWTRLGGPSREIKVVGITGTKGKTTTAELINAILEEAGFKTALAGTLRFKIGDEEERNLYKMTTPGRFFIQKFLRRAVSAKCDYAVLELTSEGAKQFRHAFIDLDALIFLNLAPEHIESHGSYEKYKEAKLKIAEALARSKKKNPTLIANADDKESGSFLALPVTEKRTFSLADAKPYTLKENGSDITIDDRELFLPLPGVFNIYNALAAITFAKSQKIPFQIVKKALENIKGVRGRMEKIEVVPFNGIQGKQEFLVYVDYAHTPGSLEAVYQTFPDKNKICVLGNTGGGRDKWKRPEMGKIADHYCSRVILTNEDPYDEDPMAILEDMKKGITRHMPEIILNRRMAIQKALSYAKPGEVVFITGKGTDPYIMGKRGKKEVWDDATVVREELQKLNESKPAV